MKYLLPLSFLTLALVLTGCQTPGGASAAAATAAPAAAAATQDDSVETAFDGIVADFEGDGVGTNTYKGGSSTVSVEQQEDVFHGGKVSLKIDTQAVDYMGVVIIPEAYRLDFTGKSKISFFMKAKNSGEKINVILEDSGKEQFSATIVDSSADWKEYSIPLARFKSRTDYQAGDANVDKKVDYPLKSIHIFSSNSYKGVAYIDDVRVD